MNKHACILKKKNITDGHWNLNFLQFSCVMECCSSFDFFFLPFKNAKISLSSQAVQKHGGRLLLACGPSFANLWPKWTSKCQESGGVRILALLRILWKVASSSWEKRICLSWVNCLPQVNMFQRDGCFIKSHPAGSICSFLRDLGSLLTNFAFLRLQTADSAHCPQPCLRWFHLCKLPGVLSSREQAVYVDSNP